VNEKYACILPHSRKYSPEHPPVPNGERAAQFAPFAALTGFEEAIDETARFTDGQTELSESSLEELDRRMRLICRDIAGMPEISVTYYVRDARKDGGKYVSIAGRVSKVDAYRRLIVFSDGRTVDVDSVVKMSGSLFGETEAF